MAWLCGGLALLVLALAAVWIVGHMPGLIVLCWWPPRAAAQRVIRGEVTSRKDERVLRASPRR